MKSLQQFIMEAHSHYEKRSYDYLDEYGNPQHDERNEYIVDKHDMRDWADFLRGNDKLGDNLKTMKYLGVGLKKVYLDGGKFESLVMRWKDTDEKRKDSEWTNAFELEKKSMKDIELAKELYKDVESARTDKMDIKDFTSKWKCEYDDDSNYGDSDKNILELRFTHIESGKKLYVIMNASLC